MALSTSGPFVVSAMSRSEPVAGPVLPAASSFLPATASVDLEIRPAGYLSDEPGSPFSEEVQSQKYHRVCWTRLTQLCNFQVAVQDLHECMAVRSVRAEITVPFTEETLQEQLRVALLHAEECFDCYIVAETLSFDTFFSKCVNGVTLRVCTA